MNQPTSPSRILIIKPSALGDVVTAMPVLRGLRRAFPQAHIAWMVANSCSQLIEHDSDLSEIILFERKHLGRALRSPRAAWDLLTLLRRLRGGRFDWVIDLQGLLRSGLFTAFTRASARCGFRDGREGSPLFYNFAPKVHAQHTVERNMELLQALGVETRLKDFSLQVQPQACQWAQQMLSKQGWQDDAFIICVPPTRWPTKLYPVRHWRQAVAAIAKYLPVALVGAPGDEALCQAVQQDQGPGVVNLAGTTTVAQMVALIARARGVVCSDSAAKFIAPAVGTDVVTLLGPTRVEYTGPFLPHDGISGQAIQADVKCRGCLKKQCRHNTCMEFIDPAEVIQAALGMIRRRGCKGEA